MQPKHLPIDLLNKTFSRRLRGFDRSAVSSFLEEVATSMEEVMAENASLSQRLQAAEAELSRYKAMESTLNEALILAQKTSRDINLNAQKQAELILNQASQDKEGLLRSAKEEVASLEEQIDELNRAKHRFLSELKGLLTSIWEMAQGSPSSRPTLPLSPEPQEQPEQEESIPLLSRISW